MQYLLSLGLGYISLWYSHLSLLLKHNIPLPKSVGCQTYTLNLLCLSNIINALLPFRYPIKLAMLVFGGMLSKRCIWSGIICPSIISTLLYLHKVFIISCKSFRVWLYIIFLRYFGTITIWYLHNYFVCDKLFVLLAIKILLPWFSKTWTTLLYYFGEFFCITTDAHPHSGWFFVSDVPSSTG